VRVVADAGPLLALAKTDGLATLFRLYPKVYTPPAVYEEVVTAGHRLAAPDATVVEERFRMGHLEVLEASRDPLPVPGNLGAGEEESIRLALQQGADWLLMDDLDARRAAEACFRAAGAGTRVQGTLGIIVSARQQNHVGRQEAIEIVERLDQRLDVWISPALCRRVIDLLREG
jgi:predicted nucleic acid-binding protein